MAWLTVSQKSNIPKQIRASDATYNLSQQRIPNGSQQHFSIQAKLFIFDVGQLIFWKITQMQNSRGYGSHRSGTVHNTASTSF
jgi:hypothetical protein